MDQKTLEKLDQRAKKFNSASLGTEVPYLFSLRGMKNVLE
jgi:hypothetical protein